MTPLDAARREAEEALAHHATCPGGGKWRECSSSLANALSSLLAALPAAPVWDREAAPSQAHLDEEEP